MENDQNPTNENPKSGKDRQLANLKMFPPGKSGNPNGRPKGAWGLKKNLKRILTTRDPEVFKKITGVALDQKTTERMKGVRPMDRAFGAIVAKLMNGDKVAWDIIMRIAPELVEDLKVVITGDEDGAPIKLNANIETNVEEQIERTAKVIEILQRASAFKPEADSTDGTDNQ
jgi:hypothetical protein